MEWVKGHNKVMGNEKADEQAAIGREERGRDKETFILCAYLDRMAREGAINEWQERWEK